MEPSEYIYCLLFSLFILILNWLLLNSNGLKYFRGKLFNLVIYQDILWLSSFTDFNDRINQ